jgi:hypothetical protein
MLTAGCASSIAVELAIGIQIVCFEIAIHRFAAGTCGSTARRRLDDDEWRVLFLGNFRRRQPGLLQRSVLTEQRFL